MLYPGAGSFAGVLGWTKEQQYRQEMAAAEQKYGPIFAQYQEQPIPKLAANAEAVGIGRRLFLNHCATCHASDAGGARGFPNLRDRVWQWGGDPQAIEQTILDGRRAVMPVWQDAIGDDGVEQVAAYVQELAGREVDTDLARKGEAIFSKNCAACHGAAGEGNPALGAPDLTDEVWLYGGSPGVIRQSIAQGRNGEMPPHREFLGEAKVHLLAAYVYSLSSEREVAQQAQ